ncbi:MAG: biotin/lipoyl-binding protein [Anaerolineales bacterium]|nr:biotin/lipoyl-binding protein [Anaerolineales bacterium]
MKYYTKVNNQEYEIEIDHEHEITVNGEKYVIDFQQLPDAGLASLLINNQSLEAVVEDQDESWEVLMMGKLYTVKVQDERTYRLALARGLSADSGEGEVKAPMPGIIIAVPAVVGNVVKQGDKVIILESMKMENELRAPRDGIITQVKVTTGASVEKDQVLLVISDPETGD